MLWMCITKPKSSAIYGFACKDAALHSRDYEILKQARNWLCAEWALAADIPIVEAQAAIERALHHRNGAPHA